MNTDLPQLIRQHLQRVLAGGRGLDLAALVASHPELASPGACFITLTAGGALRGCIGSLVAHRSLAADLLANGVAAATQDPRFSPVDRDELDGVRIEVSLLSPPQLLSYRDGEELLRLLRPGVDGVVLSLAGRRSTFLPQVWEQLPDPRQFLEHLCRKAGLSGECWRQGARIEIYTVEKVGEGDE